jgi:hypothetical protein
LLAIAVLGFASFHPGFAQETSAAPAGSEALGPGGKADPDFLAKKATIFKQFNVREAKPGEYPITALPKDKVPPVMHDALSAGDIAWLDNDTVIYVPESGLKPQEIRSRRDALSLISLNLKTLETKELFKLNNPHFCYDYETKNFFAASFLEPSVPGEPGQRIYIHGKLGEKLTRELLAPLKDKRTRDKPYHNGLDCTFFPAVPEPGTPGRTLIRIADGYLSMERKNDTDIPGAFVLQKPDGKAKHFRLGDKVFGDFHYDYFSKQYWHYEDTHWQKGTPDGIKVWRLDRNLNVVSEEFYRHGPWAYGYPLHDSVRPGFLIGSAMWGGTKLTAQTRIHDLFYLTTKDGTITEVAEDLFAGGPSVSPDGCKTIFRRLENPDHGVAKQTGELVVLDVCKTSKGDKP